MFCPDCGSLLMPKKVGEKKVLSCSCGYSSEKTDVVKLKEDKKTEEHVPLEVADSTKELLPIMDQKCDKCGNEKAYFWEIQTRAGDEPATKFFKCTKCKKTWRDYS